MRRFILLMSFCKMLTKLYTTGLLLDMSRAFDFFSYDLLLTKLEYNGFGGPALSWLETYLKIGYIK